MVERGFTDPRYTADIPSLSRLAEACGMHTSTISAAIKGSGRRPSAATVVALTRALGDDVADWLGEERASTWDPPAESSLLTGRQRKAVEEIIRAMTERREDVGNDERSAATSQAPGSGATVHELSIAEASDRAAETRKAARRGKLPRNPLEGAGEEGQGEAPEGGA